MKITLSWDGTEKGPCVFVITNTKRTNITYLQYPAWPAWQAEESESQF